MTPCVATIALISSKGGVGKSTLALALAWEVASRSGEALAVDADADRQGTLLEAIGLALATGRAGPTAVAMRGEMHRAEQLPRLSQHYPHTIIDTPGGSDQVMDSALLVADVALIPVGQYAPDVWAVQRAIARLKSAQEIRPKLRGALVMSRVLPRTTLGKDLRRCLSAAGIPVLQTQVTQRVAWGESMGAGVGVAQYAPKDKAADEARALLSEVLSFARAKGRAA